MKYFVFMSVWSKKKFHLNIQHYLKNKMLTLHNYRAATAAQSAYYNTWLLTRMCYSEYFRDKVNMLYHL